MKRLMLFFMIMFCILSSSVCSVQAADEISVTVVTSLDFGRVYMGSPAQDISPASSRAAQILVEANTNDNLNYEVEVGWFWGLFNFTFIENQDGSGSLLVSNVRTSLENDTGTIEGGEDTFGIGGTLQQVPYDIESGEYKGNMSFTVTLSS